MCSNLNKIIHAGVSHVNYICTLFLRLPEDYMYLMICMYCLYLADLESEQAVALYPGSSKLFNDHRIKMREPGKIHRVHNREGGWDLAWHVSNLAYERSLVYLHLLRSWPVRACLFLVSQVCLTQLSFCCASPSKSP